MKTQPSPHGKAAAIGFALLAAALYAVNIPLSKLLLARVAPVMMAALLYFGAGVGMAGLSWLRPEKQPPLTRADLPFVFGMILLDIAAPICLMLGLRQAASAHVALLNNFEIVATALIALLLFRERISPLMWVAIGLITVSSMLLSFEGKDALAFSKGSLFVLAACVCWGLENNCTRRLSDKSAAQIVLLKGLFSGLGSLLVALLTGERLPALPDALMALALGFVSYGLSIYYYVKAQSRLGAARTSAYYAVNPFVGALLSLVITQEALAPTYPIALLVMLAGTACAVADTLRSDTRTA